MGDRSPSPQYRGSAGSAARRARRRNKGERPRCQSQALVSRMLRSGGHRPEPIGNLAVRPIFRSPNAGLAARSPRPHALASSKLGVLPHGPDGEEPVSRSGVYSRSVILSWLRAPRANARPRRGAVESVISNCHIVSPKIGCLNACKQAAFQRLQQGGEGGEFHGQRSSVGERVARVASTAAGGWCRRP